MLKKITLTAVACLCLISLLPSAGLAWYHGPPPVHHHHHHGGDAWAWGLTGLVLGGALVAAATQPVVYAAPAQEVVYVQPPAASVYAYPPEVPPGMCRWERYILDPYGRTVLDRNDQPVKEYTLGSCQYPPY